MCGPTIFLALLFLGSPPPALRVTTAMHDCNHYDSLVTYAVEDSERKALQNGATSIAMQYSIGCRVIGDSVESSFDLINKVAAQTGVLRFIPKRSISDIFARLETDANFKAHRARRMLPRTSFDGSPRFPSSSNSSSLRSNSSRCGIVKGSRS